MTLTEMKNIAFHAWAACRSLIESGFDADFNSYWEARENTLKERYILDPLDQPDAE